MRFLYILFITFFLFFTTLFGAFFWLWNNHFVDFSVLENYSVGKPSVLLDDKGQVWAKFEIDKREPISLSHVPKHTIQAFMAAEDRNFFRHHGISVKGIIRSTLVNLKHRRIVQGASTITQQLVKLLFFDSKRTFKRKLKEQFLSLIVEKQFTKNQILETYLNHIYFGCGVYGISAACKRFFGKKVSEINPAESAVLAGIQKCPGLYCPLLNLEKSLSRRNLILNVMHDLKFLNKSELEEYLNQELKVFEPENNQVIAPHLKETIRQFLEDLYGKETLYKGGLKIQTTLNRDLQLLSEKFFKKKFSELKNTISENIDGALVSLSCDSGEIKAIVGGYSFKDSQFNRALQAKRQIGSVFKPFVYAAALKKGYDFSFKDIDEPLEIVSGGSVWKPQNYTRKFEGEMTLARALSLSNNILAVKTFMRVGARNVIDLAKKAHINSYMPPYPALALGSVDVTLIEAVRSFNIFSNNGYYVEPHFIKWVKNSLGKKIWKYEVQKEFVLDSRIVGQVNKVLSLGIKRFTKRMGTKLNFQAFGKTGTTNDSRTCWFIGSNPELITALYVGNDDNTSLGSNIYPVRTVFPIWLDIYKNYNFGIKKFNYDLSLKKKYINWFTGELGYKGSKEIIPIYV